MIGTGTIAENLERVDEMIHRACARAGRRRDDVTLVVVSKTFPASAVQEAVDAGARNVGENRVQELRDKSGSVRPRPRWHLIGHLQSNKAKEAARLADVIQTIDGISLAEKVARAALQLGKTPEIMVEVNIGREPQKSGVDPDEAADLVAAVRQIDGIRFTGLMAIPPVGDEASTRGYFRAMVALRDRVDSELGSGTVAQLSFGMSDDFEIAVEEGADVIRVGRAIFGGRS